MLKPAIQVALLLRIIFAFEVFANRARDRRLDDDDARRAGVQLGDGAPEPARRRRLLVVILALSLVAAAIVLRIFRTPQEQVGRVTRQGVCGQGGALRPRDPARALDADPDLHHHARRVLDAERRLPLPGAPRPASPLDRHAAVLHQLGRDHPVARAQHLGRSGSRSASRSRSARRPATRSRASASAAANPSSSRSSRTRAFPIIIIAVPLARHLPALGHRRLGPRRRAWRTSPSRSRSSIPHDGEHLRRDLGRARGGGDDARLHPPVGRSQGHPAARPARASPRRRSSSFVISWNEVFAASTLDAAPPDAACAGARRARRGAAAVPPRRRLLPARAGAARHLLHPQVPLRDVGQWWSK